MVSWVGSMLGLYWVYWVCIGVIRLYRNNGKENGNYYLGFTGLLGGETVQGIYQAKLCRKSSG